VYKGKKHHGRCNEAYSICHETVCARSDDSVTGPVRSSLYIHFAVMPLAHLEDVAVFLSVTVPFKISTNLASWDHRSLDFNWSLYQPCHPRYAILNLISALGIPEGDPYTAYLGKFMSCRN